MMSEAEKPFRTGKSLTLFIFLPLSEVVSHPSFFIEQLLVAFGFRTNIFSSPRVPGSWSQGVLFFPHGWFDFVPPGTLDMSGYGCIGHTIDRRGLASVFTRRDKDMYFSIVLETGPTIEHHRH